MSSLPSDLPPSISTHSSGPLVPFTHALIVEQGEPAEDPCAVALALLNSMAPMLCSLREDSHQTLSVLNGTFKTLSQRYAALEQKNQALQTRLKRAVAEQQSKMARYTAETDALTREATDFKVKLGTMKEMTRQIPAKIKEKIDEALAKKAKAILQATQAGKSEVFRLRREYGLIHPLQGPSKISMITVLQAFEAIETSYKATYNQLVIDERAAARACDEKSQSTTPEEYRESTKKLRDWMVLSHRVQEAGKYTILLEKVRLSVPYTKQLITKAAK